MQRHWRRRNHITKLIRGCSASAGLTNGRTSMAPAGQSPRRSRRNVCPGRRWRGYEEVRPAVGTWCGRRSSAPCRDRAIAGLGEVQQACDREEEGRRVGLRSKCGDDPVRYPTGCGSPWNCGFWPNRSSGTLRQVGYLRAVHVPLILAFRLFAVLFPLCLHLLQDGVVDETANLLDQRIVQPVVDLKSLFATGH